MRKTIRLNCDQDELELITLQLTPEQRAVVLLNAARKMQAHRVKYPDPLEAIMGMGREPLEEYEKTNGDPAAVSAGERK